MKPLSDQELGTFAEYISTAKLRNIAVRHLGLSEEQVDSLSDEYSRERTKFKKEILIKWRNMNSSEGNARQVCNGHADYARCCRTRLRVF